MVYTPGGNISEQKQVETLIVGGGPGGRIAYMALSKMRKGNTLLVMNEERIVVFNLPYGVGRRLIPGGPEDVVPDLAKTPRLPADIFENTVIGQVVSLDADKREAVSIQRKADWP
jgi:NADH oxidase (H2O2-forming)